MKKIALSILFVAAVSIVHAATSQKTACMLLDLDGHEAVVYDPFLGLLQAAGFNPTYAGLDTFIDTPAIVDQLATEYKGLFLVVNVDLLKNIAVSPVGKKLTALLERVARVPNFFVCLLLPNFNGARMHELLLPALHPLLDPLGMDTRQMCLLDVFEKQTSGVISGDQLAASAIDYFLKRPINTRPMPFHTTLALPHGGAAFESRILRFAQNSPTASLTLLPTRVGRLASPKTACTLPYFVYTFNKSTKLHLLVGYAMLANGFGITEQFHIRPLKIDLMREMLNLIGLALAQFHGLVTKSNPEKKDFHAVVAATKAPDCRAVTRSFGKKITGNARRVLRTVAWMEIATFEPLTPEQEKKESKSERAQRQKELIDYIVTAKLDALWITFNPHQYWSSIARKVGQKEAFLASVGLFTRQLAAACKKAKMTPPALLVGFEITNNIYAPNLPTPCAVDAFGNSFADVPAPLDDNFWRNEVVDSLAAFCAAWRDPKISNGLQLRGAVLDLEMYCRKQISSFAPVVGFDKQALLAFDSSLDQPDFTVHSAVQKLMEQSRYSAYLADRTDKAYKLGLSVRAAIKKQLGDDAYVVCYAQNLMIDWFYKGLYKGLGTQDDPLTLLTFNVEFVRHKAWLERNNIFINHGCVLMLSKIRSTKYFGYIDFILQAHHTAWLNRFSRLVEKYEPQSWIGIEQAPLSEADKRLFARDLSRVGKGL